MGIVKTKYMINWSIKRLLFFILLLTVLDSPLRVLADEPKDLGVDIAIVKSQTANLRKQAGTSSPVLQTLKRGDMLVLINRNPYKLLGTIELPVDSSNQPIIDTDKPLNLKDTPGKGDWYNVIDITSGQEGWIHGDLVNIRYTKNKKSANIFSAEKVPTIETPEVVVKNDSYKDLRLKIGNDSYMIEKNSQKTIHINEGTFEYYASAPGVIPALGEQSFQSGYRYTWRFWIETKVGFGIGKPSSRGRK